MNIVNLTPHELTLFGENEEVIGRVPPSGKVARVKTQATEVGQAIVRKGSVPIVATSYGEIENLPAPQEDTIYVVAMPVVQNLRGQRTDVVAPDTGSESVVRDAQGNIKGVRRFTR